MADYRLTKCQNGWLVIEDAGLPYTEAVAANKLRTWIAHTAAEAGEIIGREEGEGPRLATEGVKDTPEQEKGRD